MRTRTTPTTIFTPSEYDVIESFAHYIDKTCHEAKKCEACPFYDEIKKTCWYGDDVREGFQNFLDRVEIEGDF